MADDEQHDGRHQWDPQQLGGHQGEVGADQRHRQSHRDQRRRPRLDPGQQQRQIGRDQQHGCQRDIRRPGRLHEEIFLQDAGHRVREDQHRRHRRRNRRNGRGAEAGCRGSDQNDLVAILVGWNLAAQYVVEGIHLERRLCVPIAVEVGEHLQIGVGTNGQLAELHAFAVPDRHVLRLQVQAARRDHQRQRRKQHVVVAHHQGLGPDAAVDVDAGVEMPHAAGDVAQGRNGDHRIQDGGREIASTAGLRRQRQDAVLHVGRQLAIGVAQRFAIELLKHHRQQDVLGGTDARGKLAVGVQVLFGFTERDLHFGQRLLRDGRCGLELHDELVDIDQTGVDLRLGEEHRTGDRACLRLGEQVDHLRVHVAWPGPATDVADALVVDGNHRDPIARRLAGGAHAHVVGDPFDALDGRSARHDEHRKGDHHRDEPVRFPESEFAHASCLSLRPQ